MPAKKVINATDEIDLSINDNKKRAAWLFFILNTSPYRALPR